MNNNRIRVEAGRDRSTDRDTRRAFDNRVLEPLGEINPLGRRQ